MERQLISSEELMALINREARECGFAEVEFGPPVLRTPKSGEANWALGHVSGPRRQVGRCLERMRLSIERLQAIYALPGPAIRRISVTSIHGKSAVRIEY
ncbi:hypothetical protein R0381_002761 [Jeongeupia wiesaeckerbachi]|uniref:hypothetical protein n=1 Tax=Jeongeupia wiesaeckerbachi TaxID=3051218 RepID=UPI003D800E23